MARKPYMIGIAGGSCSGKSSLAREVAGLLADRSPVRVSLDAYYRDLSELPPAERELSNFDVPEALDYELLTEQLKELAQGRKIESPVYRFSTHTRAPETRQVRAGACIIVEGLFTFYWQDIRDLFQTRVFIEVDEQTSLSRRLERDTRERGRTPESVRAQYQRTVGPMYQRYILPTRQFAHLVISGEAPAERSALEVMTHIEGSWK